MLAVTEGIDHHKEEDGDVDDEDCHGNCVNISQAPTVTTPLRSLSKNTVTCSSSSISHDINNDGLTERINHSSNNINNNNDDDESSSSEECEIIVPIVSSSMFSTTTKKLPIPFSNRFKKRRKRKKKRRISEIPWGQNIEALLVGVAAFTANTLIIGFIVSLAIYYVEFKDAFSDSHGLISLSVFLPTGIFGSVGLLSGMFLNKFGVRITAISGSLLLSIGVGVCAFVPNVIFLFVFLGAFAGTGCSFLYLSVTMGLCSYFKHKSRLLMPLVTMGEAAGTIIFPPLTSYLIEIYFWRGSLLLMSGVMLQSTVCAMMYSVKNHQEIKSSHKKQTDDKYPHLIDGKNDTDLCETLSNSSLPTQTTNIPLNLDSPPKERSENLLAEEPNASSFINPNLKNSNKNKENSKNSVDDSLCKESKELEAQEVIIEYNPRENSFLDPGSNSEMKTNADLDSSFKTGVSKIRQRDTFLSIVKNKQYVLFLTSVFVIAGCINTTLTVLPDFCVYQGLTLSESANIYAIGASGDALSRIIGGWLLFRNQFSSLVIFTVSGIISGLLTAIYPLLSSFYVISILSFFVMFHSGLLFSVYSVVILDFFDINHYAIAIGLSETVAGCGIVTIGYIIGFLTEYNNGSYMVSFYLVAAMSVTCMLPMLILCLYKRRKVSVKNP